MGTALSTQLDGLFSKIKIDHPHSNDNPPLTAQQCVDLEDQFGAHKYKIGFPSDYGI